MKCFDKRPFREGCSLTFDTSVEEVFELSVVIARVSVSSSGVAQFITMKIEVKKASDVELSYSAELESSKVELRKKIRTARRLLSLETVESGTNS